jgi:signal transduction histidine kinase
MDHVRRVIVHDKPPIFEPETVRRPANRVVLSAAGLALLIQIGAIVDEALGRGLSVPFLDHVAFAAVSLLWLALGVLVFLQRRSRGAGRLFLLSASCGSAFLALGTLFKAGYVEAVLFAAGLLFFPVFLLSFARAFHEDRPWRRAELWLFLPPLLLLIPSTMALESGQTTPLWRLALLITGLYLIGSGGQALADLLTAGTAERAAQSRGLLFGLLAGTLPGLALFIAPLVIAGGLVTTLTWLPTLILVFLLSMSYSVLLFEFSEADLIVRRGVVYGVLTLVIVIAYAVLGVLLTAGGTAVTRVAGARGFVAVTVMVGAAFAPIQYYARRLVDWLLYGRRADRWGLLQALSARLAALMQPDELGDVLVTEIARALHLRGAFLLRHTGTVFEVRHVAGAAARSGVRFEPVPVGFTIPAVDLEAALNGGKESVLIVHRKPATAKYAGVLPNQYQVLDDLDAVLSLPFLTRSGLQAVLCLQPKLAHDAFDADDLELLAPVIRQAVAALDNALLFARLGEKVEELRHAYMRIAREQEAERARLARELHDGTAQELAGLITLATVAERQMHEEDGVVRGTLDRLRRQAEDAYQEVRRASHALRPLMLDDFGLVPTLVRYLDQFMESTGIEVEHHIEEVSPLADDVELALFRVAQECMENVRKHSGARCARLRLTREGLDVTLTVSDDGRGMVDAVDPGIGLVGMRERIESVGGSIEVGSEPDGGVRVVARVSLEETWQKTLSELS